VKERAVMVVATEDRRAETELEPRILAPVEK